MRPPGLRGENGPSPRYINGSTSAPFGLILVNQEMMESAQAAAGVAACFEGVRHAL